MLMSLIRAAARQIRPAPRSGGSHRGGVDALAAITSAAQQPQQDELDRPPRVYDRRADIGTNRAFRLQDVERIRPGVQRGVKEENEQQAPPAAVVERGRDDRERDRAHHEQPKWEMALRRDRDEKEGEMPDG